MVYSIQRLILNIIIIKHYSCTDFLQIRKKWKYLFQIHKLMTYMSFKTCALHHPL